MTEDFVEIRFVCRRNGHHPTVVGRFQSYTMSPPQDATEWSMVTVRGSVPEEAGRPAGQEKILMFCYRCNHEKELRPGRITAALAAVLANPNTAPGRVVPYFL